MAGQHRDAAIMVALFFTVSRLRGSKRRLCGFPSPEADDIQQPTGEAEQDQAQNIRVHCISD